MAEDNRKTIKDRAQEDLVSASPDYFLKVSSFFSDPQDSGQGQRRDRLPFYLEIVDRNLSPVSINFPPLKSSVLGVKMMVNPESISNNMAKIINRQQSMVGWIEDHWGEELDTITFQGRTASFILNSGNINRRLSISYREFQKLIPLMASNGCEFDDYGFVRKRLFLSLTYDYSKYIGYMESLDVIEDANNPFTFTYTVTFKAERTVYSFVTR